MRLNSFALDVLSLVKMVDHGFASLNRTEVEVTRRLRAADPVVYRAMVEVSEDPSAHNVRIARGVRRLARQLNRQLNRQYA